MRSEEIRHRVLGAIRRGEVPHGGPSELAALDLLDDAPAGYWQRWSEKTAGRIREQAAGRRAAP